ncbi:RNA-directed DNA polymerase, eukaryota, reverse transcriptase zinc-binding domain protein [Tanacetum coccineum]
MQFHEVVTFAVKKFFNNELTKSKTRKKYEPRKASVCQEDLDAISKLDEKQRTAFETIIYKFQKRIEVTSGIAASIRPGGRTAHSRFKIPLDLVEGSICRVSKQISLASLIKDCKLIIGDEALMAKRADVEALKDLLQDLTDSTELFGGKVIVLAGDSRVRQTLPIVHKLHLKESIRAFLHPAFAEFLFKIGEETEYVSFDETIDPNDQTNTNYEDFLHSLTPNGAAFGDFSCTLSRQTTVNIMKAANQDISADVNNLFGQRLHKADKHKLFHPPSNTQRIALMILVNMRKFSGSVRENETDLDNWMFKTLSVGFANVLAYGWRWFYSLRDIQLNSTMRNSVYQRLKFTLTSWTEGDHCEIVNFLGLKVTTSYGFGGKVSSVNSRVLKLILQREDFTGKMNMVVSWNDVNRIIERLTSWKAKALSIGGRITLIKSILGSLPIYYLSLFKAPLKIINLLESIRSIFFWGFKDSQRRISWVKWKSILLDKELGGLGVGCLHSKNLSLLGKWKWRFLDEGHALWRMVITEFYGPDGGFGTSTGGAIGGVWADILKAVKHIEDIDSSFNVSFILKISNGSNTSFWKDHWCGDGSRLMDVFPRLYALESFKDCKINDRWHCLDGIWSGNWSWRCPPRGRALDELSNLVSRIGNLSLDLDRVDKWSWAGETSGVFKVKILSKKIQNLSLNNFSLGKHHYWNSWIPRKVNICVWRASLDRLPSRANLAIRGIDHSSTSCRFCETELEDIDHSLIRCPYVTKVWRKVWSWWNLTPPNSFPSFSISDVALGNFLISPDGCPRLSKVMQGVFQCSLWAIWKWRNKLVNSQSDDSSIIKDDDIFPSIQRLSKTWISARIPLKSVNWNCWIARPSDLFV